MTYGARVIDSTPPPMNTSPSPTAIAWAAVLTACSPEPHSRLTVSPPTSTGKPASSSAIRATLRLSSPAWLAQPRMTSSTSAGVDAGPVHDRAQDERGEVVRPDARERAAVTPDRRADGLDDPRLADGSGAISTHRADRSPSGAVRHRPRARRGPADALRRGAWPGRCRRQSRHPRPRRGAASARIASSMR